MPHVGLILTMYVAGSPCAWHLRDHLIDDGSGAGVAEKALRVYIKATAEKWCPGENIATALRANLKDRPTHQTRTFP